MQIASRHQIALIVSVSLVLSAGCFLRPAMHLFSTKSRDTDELEQLPSNVADDASRLNQTPVAEIWDVPIDHSNPEKQISELLNRAQSEGLRVSIAGAQHSMGGHTIYPGGIVINMLPWKSMELDPDQNILTVQSGAIWSDVIEYLDQHGRSVEIMQSNNSFSVGGSLSVNCHGWQYDRPPIASSVRSFRLMLADGTIVRCSREENQELFSLALGGYGLFGIILDAELKVRRNERYRLEQHVVRVDDALDTFDSRIRGRPDVQMVYARMNISPNSFLNEVILNAFFLEPEGEIPALRTPGMADIRRAIFRGSVASDYGKELRWEAETKLQPLVAGKVFSRNQLLNESVDVLQNRTADTTDILHEYFVPRHRLPEFVAALRRIIPEHGADLLNITIRAVNEDKDSFLRYADQPMIAFVMLFVQRRDSQGEQQMQAMTRDLINAALDSEGRYYLPYRLHATQEQFRRAYPQADEFFARKRSYDPHGLFQNEFYRTYAAPQAARRRGLTPPVRLRLSGVNSEHP